MFSSGFGLILAICWISPIGSSTGAVHKIHNIVLYPDKHSWCKTTEIKQIVTYSGCSSVEIDNSVCVGACFSYTIPKTLPIAPGNFIAPYCDSCQPDNYTWKEVKLSCQDESSEKDGVIEFTTKVQVINSCSCTTCSKNALGNDDHKNVSNEKSKDVPELMSLMMHHHQKELEEEEEDEFEEATETQNLVISKKDEENMINVDDDNIIKANNLEILKVNDPASQSNNSSNQLELIPGPHHSLVLKPELEIQGQLFPLKLKTKKDDEEVPSLLANQFKIHENMEYLDQIAVESKEQDSKLLPLPSLIYNNNNNKNSSEHGIKIVEVADDKMKPAEEGVELSYIVKDAKD